MVECKREREGVFFYLVIHSTSYRPLLSLSPSSSNPPIAFFLQRSICFLASSRHLVNGLSLGRSISSVSHFVNLMVHPLSLFPYMCPDCCLLLFQIASIRFIWVFYYRCTSSQALILINRTGHSIYSCITISTAFLYHLFIFF